MTPTKGKTMRGDHKALDHNAAERLYKELKLINMGYSKVAIKRKLSKSHSKA
jgi:hypothetical protein